MNCSHSAGAEGSGGTSGLTAGRAGHLVNFNNHPDLCYPLHTPQLSLPPCLPSSWEQLFLQNPADFKPRAQSPTGPAPSASSIHPSIVSFSPSLSPSTISSFLFTKKRCLCSRTLLMRHNSTNSTGLHCLKSEFLDIVEKIWSCFLEG